MNIVDLILILVVLLAVWNGWQRGFIRGTIALIIWFGSIVVAFLLYRRLSFVIDQYFPSLGIWSAPVAFLFILLIVSLIFSSLFRKLLNRIRKRTHDNKVNKFFGIIPGFINGIINATIIAALLLALPLFDRLSDSTRNSKIAASLTPPAEWAESKLSAVFGNAVNRTMNKLTVAPDSKESVNLPFTVTHTKVREDLEAKMLVMINEERAKEGLRLLKADTALTAVARDHSRDMFAKGYFSHISKEGKTPFDRIREANIRFITAGENLALAQTLAIAHDGLMNSPGHRANILRPSFGRVGIGIISGGRYGLMISQEFRN